MKKKCSYCGATKADKGSKNGFIGCLALLLLPLLLFLVCGCSPKEIEGELMDSGNFKVVSGPDVQGDSDKIIIGIMMNNAKNTCARATVTIKLYDESGDEVDTVTVSIRNWEAHTNWKFKYNGKAYIRKAVAARVIQVEALADPAEKTVHGKPQNLLKNEKIEIIVPLQLETEEYDTIVGTLKNVSGKTIRRPEVRYNLYDEDGNLIGNRTIKGKSKWEAGEEWKYSGLFEKDEYDHFKFIGVVGIVK